MSTEILAGAALVSFAAGIVVGSAGVGAAALVTPVLAAMGVPVSVAIATDAAWAAAAKVLAVLCHRKELRIRQFAFFDLLVIGVVGTGAGVVLHNHLAATSGGEDILARSLGVALLASASAIIFKVFFYKGTNTITRERARLVQRVVVFFVGLLVGMTSIGGGTLLLPLLLLTSSGPLRGIVAVQLVLGLSLSGTAGLAQAAAGNIDYVLLQAMLVGLPGVALGAKLHEFVPARAIASSSAVVIAVAGFRLIL